MSKLLDRVRDEIRTLHYSIRTEAAYVSWTKQFILFHGKKHPLEMGEAEVKEFLTYLAVERNVAASTQNQALSALLFLYKVVLDRPLEWVCDAVRAKRPERLPSGGCGGVFDATAERPIAVASKTPPQPPNA